MRKSLRNALLALLIIICLLAAGLFWLTGTTSGLHWTMQQAQHWVPGELHIRETHGQSLSQFQLSGLSYQQDDLSVALEQLTLAFNVEVSADTAWLPRLRIRKLLAKQLDLHLPPGQAETSQPALEKIPAIELKLPFSVILEQAQLREAKIYQSQPAKQQTTTATQLLAHIQQADLQAQLTDSLEIQQFSCTLEKRPAALKNTQLSLQAKLGLQKPNPLTLKANWSTQWQQAAKPLPLAGQVHISGDFLKLKLQHVLKQPQSLDLQIEAHNLYEKPQWSATLNGQSLSWPVEPAVEPIEATAFALGALQLQAEGDLKTYQFQLNTEQLQTTALSQLKLPPLDAMLKAAGNLQSIHIQKLEIPYLQGLLQAQGDIHWAEKLRANLQIETQQLNLQALWADWPQTLSLNSRVQAQFENNQLHLQHLQLNLPRLDDIGLDSTAPIAQLQGTGVVDLNQEPITLQTQLDWQHLQWPLTGVAQVQSPQGSAQLQGSPVDWQWQLATQVQGGKIPPGNWSAKGRGNSKQVSISSLQGDLLQGQMQATGQAQWAPALQAQLQLKLKSLRPGSYLAENFAEIAAQLPPEQQINAQLELNYLQQQLKIKQLQLHLPAVSKQNKDSRLSLQAHADFTEGFELSALPVSSRIQWSDLRYPLHNKAQFASAEGQIQLSGKTNDWQLQGNWDFKGENLPTSQWNIQGQGDLQQAKLQRLQAKLLGGSTALAGQVAWLPQPSWKLKLHAKNINPGQQWSQWPGKLKLKLDSQGQIHNGLVKYQAKLQQLAGKLRGQKLTMQGKTQGQGKTLQSQLKLNIGNSQLKLVAKLGKQLQADWQLQAPDLSRLLPQAQGTFKADGKLSGSGTKWLMQAKAQGENLGFEQFQLENINLALDFKKNRLLLDLAANNLRQGSQTLLDALKVKLTGKPEKHQLTLNALAPNKQLALKLNGKLDKQWQQWQGALNTLQAQAAPWGQWDLQKPVVVKASLKKIYMDKLCLAQNQWSDDKSAICAQLNWQQQKGSDVNIHLAQVPLQLIQPIIPADSQVQGKLDGKLQVRLNPQGRLHTQALLSMSPGKIRAILADEWRTFDFKGGDVRLNTDAQGIHGKVDLVLIPGSHIQGEMHLPGAKIALPLAENQALQGQLNMLFSDLRLIPGLVPALEEIEGRIRLESKISGTIASPKLSGQLNVADVNTHIPQLGLKLEQLHLVLWSDQENQIQLAAGMQSGDGEVHAVGKGTLTSLDDWLMAVEIKGDGLKVIDTPDIQGYASPDLKFRMEPGKLELSGTLEIPKAEITPNLVIGESSNHPQAVAYSEDVQIIEQQMPVKQTKKADKWQSHINVLIKLGNEINLDVVGFQSQLGGAVQIFQNPQQAGLLRGNGALYITKGIYRAYGQDLAIRQGLVIFADGPVDNPALDIKAERTIRKDQNSPPVTKAGVHITGTVKTPKIGLFSEPMVEDGQILSYLLTGSAFNSGAEQRALSLGAYITRDFYAGFSFNLFGSNKISVEDASKVFNLRYDINEKWGVEATVGDKDSGVDLSYTLGR
ncbi:translocation/assembly module TamB domain-containing protein [Candidatus Venteria ishoeyi]|uniref:translocation/assembly module TamB domain-containing protein n=1 Tax=Candidatus Venteria ishoeyi TaxID=1899563 RepID=UPI0025A67456|nr:translocation/assembly module TamB domain-containing protein [Candidatus Venteria ishoeyi]MDM8545950.1 translocation/assembly module TamB domain-containing protein [Candidatus Venteria ishoeyi]